MTVENAIEIKNLTKKFDDKVAVDNVSFEVRKGEVFGLLGPNGAGKTTTLRMITTLLNATSGEVKIFGHDAFKESATVRSMFGLTGQYASVDEDISARENLMIFSRLNGLSRKEAKQRTQDLLAEFSLIDSADKAISAFSGGMRRRLDLAVSLIARPQLVFLDEPTTGLDPRTRTQMWDTIRDLVAKGSTVVLTTQYLEEADELADRIAVIDHGKLVSLGTPDELKDSVGGSSLKVQVANDTQITIAKEIIENILHTDVEIKAKNNELSAQLENPKLLTPIFNELTTKQIDIENISVQKPSMDDVFFALTVGKN
ncbi:ATP-binding cassette domain-containing protein [Periweissella cryptocerci]|uniref:ATP-binding cassette domain-containing protein n=1 Tax=Periweissella cryptocerci TaxID=2506420 RepID=A0A4P6YX80_9LACO|nr:ATP-binding cassette domain-containing protein [Periweissella cryptocerci]QBO37474.1 ATP-binding cassette domain-containing protein [Periweissella cryptocerci]